MIKYAAINQQGGQAPYRLNYPAHKEISDEVYGAEWKVYYDVNYIIKRINRETQTSEPCERSEARACVNF